MINRLFALATLFLTLSSAAQAAEETRLIDTLRPEALDRHLPMFDSTRIFFSRVVKQKELPDYAQIVLVGFDTGRASQALADKVEDAKVLNFVLSPELVEHAELQFPHPRIETRFGDIFRPDRKLKNKADLVFSSWLVGHIPQTKQVLALKTMRYMLKDGGTGAVIFPIKGSDLSRAIQLVVDQPQWHDKLSGKSDNQTTYRPDQYANMMTRAGFKDVKAEKHVYSVYFNDRQEFEDYVSTAITHYLPVLNPSERQQFITEITDSYLEMVTPQPGGQIPFKVDMVLAVGKNHVPVGGS